jgi:thiamine pyrophosphokinase
MMHALVIAAGTVPSARELDAAWPGWGDDIELVVAADGGARGARRLGRRVDLVVGDADSLGPAAFAELERDGVAVERSPTAKDETDTELAVLAALARGATRVSIVGGLGGRRLDHALANIALLAHPALMDVPCLLLSADARVRLALAPGPHGGPVDVPLPGPAGSLVSLIPLDATVTGVTTRGLAYRLDDEPLPLGPARGISNVRTAADAGILLRAGRLLIVEPAGTLGP